MLDQKGDETDLSARPTNWADQQCLCSTRKLNFNSLVEQDWKCSCLSFIYTPTTALCFIIYRKCGAMSYSKAGMINEKKVTLAGDDLSLRGNEESRLGNYDSKVNLDIG